MTEESGLPTGWARAKVRDLLVEPMCNGISVKGTDDPPGVPALRLSAMSDTGFNYSDRRYIPISIEDAEQLAIQAGDVFVARGNGSLHLVGRATIAQQTPEQIVFPDTMIRLRFAKFGTLPQFISTLWCSREVRRQLERKARTSAGIYKISQGDIAEVELPIPPPAEQARILARVDELLSDLEAGVTALKRSQAKLKRYRAAVLRAAVTGKLTAEWRAAHPNVEPATKLLDRILAVRRRKWETDQQNQFDEKRRTPQKNWRRQYVEPVPPATDRLIALPSGWCWATIEQLAQLVTKGSSPNWQGFEYTASGIPFLRSQNVRWGELDLDELAYLPDEFNQTHSLSVIRAGDVLLNLVGASIGRAALAIEALDGGNLNQAVAIIRLLPGAMIPRLLVWFLLSPLLQAHITTTKADVARANFNLDDVRPTAIPLPPDDEQIVLLSEIEQRLSVIAATENYIEASLKRSNRLRQSILKEAFAGRLVPQDPNDEPASALLDRVRHARVASNGSTGLTRPRSRRKKSDQPELFE
jgi:type I restriction enzyme S subunit